MAMRLTIDETAIGFRNALVQRRYVWNDIAEISLSRFGTGKMVAEESIWRTFLGTHHHIAWPAVAIRSKDGRVSPPILVTLWVGPRWRRRILGALGDYAFVHSVPVNICASNPGWLFGISWDIREGTGIPSQTLHP
jgi:hypothetical protein